jgi:hypothetical protein
LTVTAGGLASGRASVVIPEPVGVVETVDPIARMPAELAPVVVTVEAVTETGPPLLA